MKKVFRTHGKVQDVLAKGQGVALEAFVHTKSDEISSTKRCEPAKPHDSAVNNVYKMCFGKVSNEMGAYRKQKIINSSFYQTSNERLPD